MPVLDRFRLDGRVAVVTGSGRGIGRGIALGMAEAGADVVVTARRPHEVDAVTAQVRALGRRAVGVLADITVDITVVETIPMLVDRAVSELGRLDICVSNAGGSEHKGNFPALEMPDERWSRVRR
jgi:NAD(P)-dependent dehydrogenase (short-subunit alcohol dehydrogenase family)